MNTKLASRMATIKPSITLGINAIAAKLKAAGQKIIDLSAGEPDFDTPEHIKSAAIAAMQAGLTKYTPVGGLPSLKQAIISKLKHENYLEYTADQIIVSCGAKHSIYNLCMVLLEPGDEVIIPAPYWVSYPEIVALTGATPVIINTSINNNFKISPLDLNNAITPQTKLLIINSPSNPCGIAYSAAELKALSQVLLQHPNVIILTDDIYEKISWHDEIFNNIGNVCKELVERMVVVNGVSKAFAMTGWRIGYAAGPKAIITAMHTLQSQITSNPCSIAQAAAEAALLGSQDSIKAMAQEFKARHDFLVAELNKIPGFNCRPGNGAFYLFPDVTKMMQHFGLADDVKLCEVLLEQAQIAVVPGSGFGAPGHIRISFAASMSMLQEAITRLKAFAK